MRAWVFAFAIACLSAGAGWAEEAVVTAEPAATTVVKVWSDEIQEGWDGAKAGLAQEQAKWLVERAQWAAARDKLRLELEKYEKEHASRSQHQWDQELENLRLQARKENEQRQKQTAAEKAKSAQAQEKITREYKHKTGKPGGDGNARAYASTRSGSSEAAGLSRGTKATSASGGSRSSEGGGGSSSISTSSTVITLEK